MKRNQIIIVIVLIAAVSWIVSSDINKRKNLSIESEVEVGKETAAQMAKADRYETAKEITTPDGFINTEDFKIADQIGDKVVLIDFWTFSCINCQRTTPYLNAWYQKYKDFGFEIIGVHTPEFEFEKDYDNVIDAVKRFGIKHPVVLDNDFSTWKAYRNNYWPRKYLIDIDGYIVYDHIGEGAYDRTEQNIQHALQERKEKLGLNIIIPTGLVDPNAETPSRVGSPEVYFGASRNVILGNGPEHTVGEYTFTKPNSISANRLYLDGTWDVQPEFSTNKTAGSIIFKYSAKNVFMVASGDNTSARILIDGQPVDSAIAGDDVVNSKIIYSEERLYKLIADEQVSEHTLEIIVEKPGLSAFTFTFG